MMVTLSQESMMVKQTRVNDGNTETRVNDGKTDKSQ